MRATNICPKCQGQSILLVRQIPDSTGLGGAQHIAVVQKSPDAWWERTMAGRLEALVCRACGYTEFYVKDPQSIPVDGKLVSEISPRRDPYR